MYDFKKYLQSKLDAIAPNQYTVSNERNVDAKFKNTEVVVSALSATITDKEATDIPYEIDIFTTQIESAMADFTVLAKTYSGEPYTEIINEQLVTITPFFNTPTVLEKDIGSQHHAKLVVFASVNEKTGINNIKSLTINEQRLELLSGTLAYAVEVNPSRVSGDLLVASKKKAATCSINFLVLNKNNAFFNTAFKIATGQIKGNTPFTVDVELDNNLKATLQMFITAYNLNSERTKLPSVSITMNVYNTL